MKSYAGFTLPEMSIAAFLLLLVISLTFGAIAPAIRVSRQAEESIASQRDIVMAFDRIVADCGMMDRLTASFAAGCFSYLSHNRFGGANPELSTTEIEVLPFQSLRAQWKKFVILRHRGTQLVLREYPYTLGNTLSKVRDDRLISVADDPDSAEKIFAHGVEEFSVAPIGNDRVLFRIRAVNRQAKKPEACDVTFQISMKGSY